MPPSGFTEQAIVGLLTFVRSAYELTLQKYKGQTLSEAELLHQSIGFLEGIVRSSAAIALGGTVSREGIQGLVQFTTTNYRDLIAEIQVGKKTQGQALQTEIDDIGAYLAQFTLH